MHAPTTRLPISEPALHLRSIVNTHVPASMLPEAQSTVTAHAQASILMAIQIVVTGVCSVAGANLRAPAASLPNACTSVPHL